MSQSWRVHSIGSASPVVYFVLWLSFSVHSVFLLLELKVYLFYFSVFLFCFVFVLFTNFASFFFVAIFVCFVLRGSQEYSETNVKKKNAWKFIRSVSSSSRLHLLFLMQGLFLIWLWLLYSVVVSSGGAHSTQIAA